VAASPPRLPAPEAGPSSPPAGPGPALRTRSGVLRLDHAVVVGILNATPDSFSDAGELRTLDEQVAHAAAQLQAGADVIDIGGESGITNRAPVSAEEETERVVPLIERVAGDLGALVSVDTYKPAVAEAAIAAGAAMVNDVSGLRDVALAELCARSGAALVVTHTVGAPKEKVLDHPYGDVAAEVAAALAEKLELARAHGVEAEQLVVDPGPDFGKSPAQTVALLRGLPAVVALGRPVMLAVSRKDFVGALTGRRPGERLGGTLAAIGFGVDAGARLLRVHDVAAAADYLAVRAALRGEAEVADDLRLADALRREE
jgi:dihydropteroate synthase